MEVDLLDELEKKGVTARDMLFVTLIISLAWLLIDMATHTDIIIHKYNAAVNYTRSQCSCVGDVIKDRQNVLIDYEKVLEQNKSGGSG